MHGGEYRIERKDGNRWIHLYAGNNEVKATQVFASMQAYGKLRLIKVLDKKYNGPQAPHSNKYVIEAPLRYNAGWIEVWTTYALSEEDAVQNAKDEFGDLHSQYRVKR